MPTTAPTAPVAPSPSRDFAAAFAEEDAPPSSLIAENPGAPVDDGAPVGPSEGEETSFLVEQREQGFTAPAAAPRGARSDAAEDEADAKAALPPLDDLVNRIPPATRQLMDELFRAKFITVKRIPKSALK